MSEQVVEQQEQQSPEPARGWDDLFEGQDPAEVKKALDESRRWESRAKENYEKAQEFDKLRDAQKSEQQKLEERLASTEKAAQTEAAGRMRLQVALEKGLTASQAKRLVGSTQEELEADADELLADIKPAKPRGDIGQGPRGDNAPADMNQFIRQAAGRS